MEEGKGYGQCTSCPPSDPRSHLPVIYDTSVTNGEKEAPSKGAGGFKGNDKCTCAHTMMPDLRTISGFALKFSGFHRTRSASLPTLTEPTYVLMSCVIALRSRC